MIRHFMRYAFTRFVDRLIPYPAHNGQSGYSHFALLVGFLSLLAAALFTAHHVLAQASSTRDPAQVEQAQAAQAKVAELEPLVLATAGGNQRFMVELVDTDETRGRGLMFRKQLAADYGMLFDFLRMQDTYFWMKNTYVSLDMIFIREDGVIARIAQNTTPLSERVIPSGAPVRFVLEVNAGTAARIGLKAGDTVIHPRIQAR